MRAGLEAEGAVGERRCGTSGSVSSSSSSGGDAGTVRH